MRCLYAWLRMATRAAARTYDGHLMEVGLRTTQFSLLARLDDDGPLALSRLAQRLAMDRTTLRRELDPLLTDGLVEVCPGGDRRQRIASLTEAGQERLALAYPRWREAQRDVRNRIGRDRIEGLLVELDALVEASQESARERDASGSIP